MGHYKYKGAEALTALHENQLRSFVSVWLKAKRKGIVLPVTDDPYYSSMNMLLFHVLQSAGGYLNWICRNLSLPDPQILPPPGEKHIEKEAKRYLAYLLEKWENRLCDVEPAAFEDKVFESNWGVPFCIDAMLEHAVMHPLRHEYQLINLMEQQKK